MRSVTPFARLYDAAISSPAPSLEFVLPFVPKREPFDFRPPTSGAGPATCLSVSATRGASPKLAGFCQGLKRDPFRLNIIVETFEANDATVAILH